MWRNQRLSFITLDEKDPPDELGAAVGDGGLGYAFERDVMRHER